MSEQVQIGDFIEIPAWKTFGMVQAIGKPPEFSPEGTIRVLLQERPDQPARAWKYYNLEPGEYINEMQ